MAHCECIMRTLKLFVCLLILGVAYADEEVTVDIPLGTLKGLKTTTVLNGKPYYSFKGIPYAKPPIGFHKFEVSRLLDLLIMSLTVTINSTYDAFKKDNIVINNLIVINVYHNNITISKGVLLKIMFFLK